MMNDLIHKVWFNMLIYLKFAYFVDENSRRQRRVAQQIRVECQELDNRWKELKQQTTTWR
jgi:hypothetical protein